MNSNNFHFSLVTNNKKAFKKGIKYKSLKIKIWGFSSEFLPLNIF